MKKLIPLAFALFMLQGNASAQEHIPAVQQYNYEYESQSQDELGIHGRRINLLVDGKFYSVNADSLPEYYGDYMYVKSSPIIATFFNKNSREYIDITKSYSNEEKAAKWIDISSCLFDFYDQIQNEDSLEKKEGVKNAAVNAFAKSLFFFRQSNKIKLGDEFRPLMSYSNLFTNFIVEMATEAYNSYDYVEPPQYLADAEKRIEDEHGTNLIPQTPLEDNEESMKNALKEGLVILLDDFMKKEVFNKDEINREKQPYEDAKKRFADEKIKEYSGNIINNLTSCLNSTSEGDLLWGIIDMWKFQEYIPLPLWSKYLCASPKWGAAFLAASEMEYYYRTLEQSKKNDFSFFEIEKLNSLNFFKILVSGFEGDEFIKHTSKKGNIVYTNIADTNPLNLYNRIKKYGSGADISFSPRDQEKIDSLKYLHRRMHTIIGGEMDLNGRKIEISSELFYRLQRYIPRD